MDGFGSGLRLAGWGFLVLGLVVMGGLITSMVMSDDFSDAPGLVIPGLFGAAGAGLLRLAHLTRTKERFGIEHVVKWVFLAVGGVMIVGGAVFSFQDPGALFLILMGAVFAGAGWFAGRYFVTPENKERLVVETTTATTTVAFESQRTITSGAFIEVDADATPAERQAAIAAWRADMLALRPDWASGRIRSNASKAGWLWLMPLVIVLAGFALVWFGMIEAQVLVFVGSGAILLGVFLLYAFAMRRRRSRIFGATILVLERSPIAPGDTLAGVLEIPAPRHRLADGKFALTLSCNSLMRSEALEERTILTTTELWSDEKTARASGESTLRVKVAFDLPADLPGATLIQSAAAQTQWTLTATAKGAGMDFREDFDLPVLSP